MTYEQFDVVVVPFPFTDIPASKRRPALVLSAAHSFNTPVGHSAMAMITTAAHSSWALDVAISDLDAAGLKAPSIVRMKLFTLDHNLVINSIGRLGDVDQDAVKGALRDLLNLSYGR
jgi:mRNA interferase MazF